MMVPTHYLVNIARLETRDLDPVERYHHFCKVEINELIPEIAEERFDVICQHFPSPEWKCTLTRVECVGYQIKEV